MKIAKHLKSGRFLPKSRKGVALVTVLTVMSLTTILVLTFFSLATSEHRASNTYSNGVHAQQVAEQAVNIVISQIRAGTEVGRNKAWASQPGAIRTWDNDGKRDFLYKLYSDDAMTAQGGGDGANDFDELPGWDNKPEIYVDLNEPVIRGQKVYYPIVNPSAAEIPQWPKGFGGDDNGVEGFSYNEVDNQKLSDQGDFGVRAAKIANAQGHVPMPVKWLYQLADGTLGVVEGSGQGGGNSGPEFKFERISGAGSPDADNPMVARFAFWADDETCKLNLNTHAGGMAWDVPKAGGDTDMRLGRYQPAQKEWQRYPGHPATTHLAPALAPGVLDIVNDREAMEMLFVVVPRVVGGGSESGTSEINTYDEKEANGLIPDNNPLFPSLDDMIMRPDRQPHEFPDAKGNPVPADEMSDYLERSKFFITVTSRAPETNIFNLPRIATWPIYNADYGTSKYNTHLTPFDRLIHYCASIGESRSGNFPRHEYIFKRENADSPTYDYDNIPRNKVLYDNFLKPLLEEDVPGFGSGPKGGSFAGKYPDRAGKGEGYGQILTQIVDYIRCANLHDDSIYGADFEQAFVRENTNDHPTYTNPRNDRAKHLGHKGHGQVVPLRINNTKGFGRYYSLASAQVVAICAGVGGPRGIHQNSLDFGATAWSNRGNREVVRPPSGTSYSNIPPMPAGMREDNYPGWLRALETSNPQLFRAHTDPKHWNWQLAFLDDQYRNQVLNDPDQRFNRNLIRVDWYRDVSQCKLADGERLIQAAFLFNMFTPSQGWGSINPDMEILISKTGDMHFMGVGAVGGGATPIEFLGWNGYGHGAVNADGVGSAAQGSPSSYLWATSSISGGHGVRPSGGSLSYGYILNADWAAIRGRGGPGSGIRPRTSGGFGGNARLTPLDQGYGRLKSALDSYGRKPAGANVERAYSYDLVTVPFKISGGAVQFKGGDVTFDFRTPLTSTEGTAAQQGAPGGETIQEITLQFEPFTVPAPDIAQSRSSWFNEFGKFAVDGEGILENASITLDPANPYNSHIETYRNSNSSLKPTALGLAYGRLGHLRQHGRANFFHDGDVVQSVEISHGDARLVAARPRIEAGEIFAKNRNYGNRRMAHSVTNSAGVPDRGYNLQLDDPKGDYLIVHNLPKKINPFTKNRTGNGQPYHGRPPLPFSSLRSDEVQLFGDFDNGSGQLIDGPYINKPDEGNTNSLEGKYLQELHGYWAERTAGEDWPYFTQPWRNESGGPAYFSPNRIMSGPGMFGSLPTGLYQDVPAGSSMNSSMSDVPWRTLLFRPDVDGSDSKPPGGAKPRYEPHYGAENPPDHLFLDLFWMPVVEPYAISEPLSTGGKVNLNYEMLPFLHIERTTALRGVFRSELMLCVPNEFHDSYKIGNGRGAGYHWKRSPGGGELQGKRLRTVIHDTDTLAQFRDRFDRGQDAFKTASEITTIHLIPEEYSARLGTGSGSIGTYTPTDDEMKNGKYWSEHALVGDNSRERPYANIYNRVTTKSNTFQVHFRAQVIKQSRRESDSEYGQWRPYTDSVMAEYRGSSIVERFVNPDDDDIPDFAAGGGGSSATLDEYYQYRVINHRRFAP